MTEGVIFGRGNITQIKGKINYTVAQISSFVCFVIASSKFDVNTNYTSNDVKRNNFWLIYEKTLKCKNYKFINKI